MKNYAYASALIAALSTPSFACAPATIHQTPVDPSELRVPPVDLQRESSQMVADLSAFRGLSLAKPVSISVLNRGSFDAAFRALPETDEASIDGKKPELASPELYQGFFSEKQRQIVVLQHVNDGVDPRRALAHEVEHALQLEYFHPESRPKLEDEGLARTALREGDAELAAIGFIERRAGRAWKRAMRAASSRASRTRLGAQLSEREKPLSTESRTLLHFKYKSGLAFASALFRAGGFDALNLALAHPPETTEQVLHPEKYLAGEKGAKIDPIPAPAGFQPVRDEWKGELAMRLYFAKCMPERAAESAAAGWAGSRRAWFSKGTEQATVVVSAWDSPSDAARAEKTFRDCFLEGAPNRWPARVVRRDGNVVSFVAGVPEGGEYAQGLSSLVSAAPPPEPPFGHTLPIPPEPRPRFEQPELHGEIQGDEYKNPWLGVSATIPRRFRAEDLFEGTAYLEISSPTAGVGMFWATTRRTPEERERFHHQVLQHQLAQTHAEVEETATWVVETPLGSGTEKRWTLSNGAWTWFLDSIVVAACDGDITYHWARYWGSALGRWSLDEWLASFKTSGFSQACEDVRDELEDEKP